MQKLFYIIDFAKLRIFFNSYHFDKKKVSYLVYASHFSCALQIFLFQWIKVFAFKEILCCKLCNVHSKLCNIHPKLCNVYSKVWDEKYL